MAKIIDSGIFRAYDIRGIYPEEINESVVSEITAFLPKILKCEKNNKETMIIIGHDTRLSSPNLYNAVIKKLQTTNYKLQTIRIGLATTPMFYFLVNYFNADAGIMITASHNPKEYNGLKVVGKNATPISGKEIQQLISNF